MNNNERETYLRSIALKVIDECTFLRECSYFNINEQMPVLLPSGDDKYPSFWVRDCAMMTMSGLFSPEDWKRYIKIIATCGQNSSQPLILENGLTVPPYCVADHINYNGKSVYFPGTYLDGKNQGNGRFGLYPPLCDNYWFIMMTIEYIRKTNDIKILSDEFCGETLSFLLKKAWQGYHVNPKTGLCECTKELRAVDWGFTDKIIKSGVLLMPSLFRINSAILMKEIFNDVFYDYEAEIIKKALVDCLYDSSSGWFFSASETGRQYDVWGTAYAICLDILPVEEKKKSQRALLEAYNTGDAIKYGYVRHVCLSKDYSDTSSWECAPDLHKGDYQNGAFWSTATGWYAYAICDYDEYAAFRLIDDYISHTKKYFCKGAPYEYFTGDMLTFHGNRYGTSATMPYEWFIKIREKLNK